MMYFRELNDMKDGISTTRILKEFNIETRFCLNEKELKKLLPEDSERITFVTDSHMNTYWKKTNFYKKVFVHEIKNESLGEVEMAETGNPSVKKVIGFGGGRVLDVAKMLAFKTGSELILIPTAPTHDGLISKNAALLNGEKKSYSTKFADKVIVPEYLWIESGDLQKAGKLDILGNIIALQDVSLAVAKGELEPDEKYLKMSMYSIKTILENGDYKSFTKALFLSGLAMEKSSRYCSGSDHELEKILAPETGNGYFHGQLVGTASLLAAKVYETYNKDLPGDLFIEPKDIFKIFLKILKERKLFEYAIRPLEETDANRMAGWLKRASAVRPERYTLWNEIDSEKIDWKKIIEEIVGEHNVG